MRSVRRQKSSSSSEGGGAAILDHRTLPGRGIFTLLSSEQVLVETVLMGQEKRVRRTVIYLELTAGNHFGGTLSGDVERRGFVLVAMDDQGRQLDLRDVLRRSVSVIV